ncbi:hypothetical protein E5D57_011969 [Metarhizium anisopliae]|nr:hypothetical protein E5D57_011969 [Metarhizium anisopliae]
MAPNLRHLDMWPTAIIGHDFGSPFVRAYEYGREVRAANLVVRNLGPDVFAFLGAWGNDDSNVKTKQDAVQERSPSSATDLPVMGIDGDKAQDDDVANQPSTPETTAETSCRC